MDSMRDVLKRDLGRSLEALPPLDRLAAAWPVACGKTMALRGEVIAYDGKLMRVEVQDATWMEQMISMRSELARAVGRIAGLEVAEIHFELRRRRDERSRSNAGGGQASGGVG